MKLNIKPFLAASTTLSLLTLFTFSGFASKSLAYSGGGCQNSPIHHDDGRSYYITSCIGVDSNNIITSDMYIHYSGGGGLSCYYTIYQVRTSEANGTTIGGTNWTPMPWQGSCSNGAHQVNPNKETGQSGSAYHTTVDFTVTWNDNYGNPHSDPWNTYSPYINW